MVACCFTAVMLHADTAHLISNVTIGALFLGFAMGSFGPGIALLAAFLAGAGGNLVDYWFYPSTHRGLGASGMVMGSLGLLTVYSFWRGRGTVYTSTSWNPGSCSRLFFAHFAWNQPAVGRSGARRRFCLGRDFGQLSFVSFRKRAYKNRYLNRFGRTCLPGIGVFRVGGWPWALRK